MTQPNKTVVAEALSILGLRVRDRITNFDGVASSACFDVYGCVQIAITPAVREGKLMEGAWFDIKRLEVFTDRAMDAPNFDIAPRSEAGAAEKPPFAANAIR